MSGGKAEADRIVHGSERIGDDLFRRSTERIRFVLVAHIAHSTYDQAGEVAEPASELQVLHHAINVVEQFIQIFEKEDLSFRIDIERCSAKRIENGKISADEDAFSLAIPIEIVLHRSVLLDMDRSRFAEEDLSQTFPACFTFSRDVEGHLCVQRSDAGAMERVMQRCNITETDDPFGIFLQPIQIDAIEQLHSSVAASPTPDRTHRWIIDRSLKIGSSFLIGPGLLEMLSSDTVPELHFQPPTFCKGHPIGEFCLGDRTGSGNDRNGVAGSERRRCDHTAKQNSDPKRKMKKGDQLATFPC